MKRHLHPPALRSPTVEGQDTGKRKRIPNKRIYDGSYGYFDHIVPLDSDAVIPQSPQYESKVKAATTKAQHPQASTQQQLLDPLPATQLDIATAVLSKPEQGSLQATQRDIVISKPELEPPPVPPLDIATAAVTKPEPGPSSATQLDVASAAVASNSQHEPPQSTKLEIAVSKPEPEPSRATQLNIATAGVQLEHDSSITSVDMSSFESFELSPCDPWPVTWSRCLLCNRADESSTSRCIRCCGCIHHKCAQSLFEFHLKQDESEAPLNFCSQHCYNIHKFGEGIGHVDVESDSGPPRVKRKSNLTTFGEHDAAYVRTLVDGRPPLPTSTAFQDLLHAYNEHNKKSNATKIKPKAKPPPKAKLASKPKRMTPLKQKPTPPPSWTNAMKSYQDKEVAFCKNMRIGQRLDDAYRTIRR